MVAIDDIKDGESFEAWLKETNQPGEVCVALAARAALRVLPYAWAWDLQQQRSPLPLLRVALLTSIAGVGVPDEAAYLGYPSVVQTMLEAAIVPLNEPMGVTTVNPHSSRSHAEHVASTIAAIECYVKVREAAGAALADDPREHTIRAADAGAIATNYDAEFHRAIVSADTDLNEFAFIDVSSIRQAHGYTLADAWKRARTDWSALRDDCAVVVKEGNLSLAPLYRNNASNNLSSVLEPIRRPTWTSRVRVRLRNRGRSADWSFWLDWYQRSLLGQMQNWPLLFQIAIQEDIFWDGADAVINGRIAQIVARHTLPPDADTDDPNVLAGAIEGFVFPDTGESEFIDRLREIVARDEPPPDPDDPKALAAAKANAANAERVVKSGEGAYDAIPVSMLPAEAFDLAKERAEKTLSDIDGLIELDGNQYSALRGVSRLVRTELGRSANRPQLVYEALMQACLDFDRLMEAEELAKGDYNIDRFRNLFNNSALDILLHDEEVRKAVEARAAFRVANLSEEEKRHIEALGVELAKASTERLGEEIVADSRTAADDDADPEKRKGAIFQFGSRTIGMYDLDSKPVRRAANAAGVGGFITTVVGWFL